MNTKTYHLTKYVSTIAAMLLFTGPLLGFLQAWKNIFHANQGALWGVGLSLTLIGMFLIGVYLLLRWNLKKKTTYKHTTKDLKRLYWSGGFYLGGAVFGLLTLLFTLTLTPPKTVMVVFGPFYGIEVIGLIVASVLESMSRINEQVYLYQQENKRLEANSDQEENEKNAYSEQGIKRTVQAQAFLRETETTEVIDPNLKAALQNALDDSELTDAEK